MNHTIKTVGVPNLDTCELLCYQENNCVSVNFNSQVTAGGTYRCELNNAIHLRHGEDFVDKVGYFYHGADVSKKLKSLDLSLPFWPPPPIRFPK